MENAEDRTPRTPVAGITPPHVSATSSVLSSIVAILALAVAGASFIRQPAIDSEKLTLDVIRQSYSDFLSISDLRITHPLQSHLFELDDYYDNSASAVHIASAPNGRTSEDTYRLMLEERAVADRIFTMYEQALYQWRHAQRNGDKQRATFLRDVLDYYTGRLLRNPRLAWYWAPDGGKLLTQYEKDTIAYYNENAAPSATRRAASAPF